MNNKQQTAVDFVPYELALELKQLGFDELCIAYYTVVPEDNINWFTISEQAVTGSSNIFGSSKNYNTEWFKTEGTISAPTYAQVFRWFREKHGLNSFVYHYGEDGILDIIYFAYNINDNLYASDFRTYEEAELACLRKLIEITNDK